MKKLTLAILLITQSVWLAPAASAQIAVIVNPANEATLDANEIGRLFMKKQMTFKGGSVAEPFDTQNNDVRSTFYKKTTKKDLSQLRAYWARMIFSGKKTPPETISSDNEIKSLVASRPNAIAYIDASKVDSSVKVVLTID